MQSTGYLGICIASFLKPWSCLDTDKGRGHLDRGDEFQRLKGSGTKSGKNARLGYQPNKLLRSSTNFALNLKSLFIPTPRSADESVIRMVFYHIHLLQTQRMTCFRSHLEGPGMSELPITPRKEDVLA